jgi:L-rhamnose isomerase/sugar isomerase
VTTDEKISDAGHVHALTGCCPTVALHVLWDFPHGLADTEAVAAAATAHGLRPGAINPNLFQDQEYKHGSFGNPAPAIRERALAHCRDSIAIAQRLGSRDISSVVR